MVSTHKTKREDVVEELKIRDAVIQDADQIAGLLKELGYPNTAPFAAQKIRELSNGENDTVLVAEIVGRVLGVAHLHVAELFHEQGRLGRIMALVVTSSERRRGIGRKLMAKLETAAHKAGCVKMEITSGGHRNDAHEFYGSLGYVEKRRRFVKELHNGTDHTVDLSRTSG
jgi:GNAT superfamily N-acetyltransferase